MLLLTTLRFKVLIILIKPEKITDFTDKAAYNYFIKKSKKYKRYENLSSEERVKLVRKIKRLTISFSAFLGALGVLFLYLPQYLIPNLFPQYEYIIPFTEIKIELSINELIYGVFLVALEIWLLTMSDIRTVGKIAAVYGVPTPTGYRSGDEEIQELVSIGLGKNLQKINEIGINPYQNNSRFSVVVIFLLFRLKAILSKFVFKFIIKRTLGRLAVRAVMDMAAVPIYAFWNAYASSIIIRKAHMRMYAHMLMKDTGKWFLERYSENSDFKNLLYDTLTYIAVVKKNFYPSDYLFAKHLLEIFNIEPEKKHEVSDDYLQRVIAKNEIIENAISKLMIIGFLIDGRLGSLEKRIIKKLQDQEVIPYSMEQIKNWTEQYKNGEGFKELLEA